jgi:Cu/Ag efflux protein CusF
VKYLIYLPLVFSFTFSSCNENAKENEVKNTKPAANIESKPTPDNSKIKTAKAKGKVTKVNLDLGSVELDHEEIKGIMPAMIMEFFVLEKSELKSLKVGDRVDFVLEENQGQEKIISIKKSQ